MSENDIEAPAETLTREKLRALYEVATFQPRITAGICVLGVVTAALGGVGLGFILPIIQQAQGDTEPSGLAAAFAQVYEFVGVPFTLGFPLLQFFKRLQ